jgi:hypothetical protein
VFCIVLEIVLLVLLLLELLRGLGFSDYDSGSLPIYLTLPWVLAVPLACTRLVLEVRWPSPTHALTHLRRVPLPGWVMGLLLAIYIFRAVRTVARYGASVASLVVAGLVLTSAYLLLVIIGVLLYVSGSPRMHHSFRATSFTQQSEADAGDAGVTTRHS